MPLQRIEVRAADISSIVCTRGDLSLKALELLGKLLQADLAYTVTSNGTVMTIQVDAGGPVRELLGFDGGARAAG